VKFSLWPEYDRTPADLLQEVRAADDAGWHGIWFADHYMENSPTAQGDVYEVWGVLPAIAAVTSRVRVGTLVSPTTFHHPALLAKRAATIDQLSGGRMVLGLGAGWQENEHLAYGVPLPEAKERVDRFEEAIQVVRALLSQERTTLHGQHFEITDAPADPKPVQSPLPILVGTRGPRMMRIAARFANEWNAWGTPESIAPQRAALAAACERVGVPMMRTSVNALIDLTGDESIPGFRVLRGSVEQVRDQLGGYAELGFDEFILPDWNLGASAAERADRLEHIRTEILESV
jgi:alkanesulfonate monooxygenase SsuD/methylene tetrahydromethanopterin reductase-like flavin-dependent oxidoreductase (luciferase family)